VIGGVFDHSGPIATTAAATLRNDYARSPSAIETFAVQIKQYIKNRSSPMLPNFMILQARRLLGLILSLM
jgi:hypothetical protein